MPGYETPRRMSVCGGQVIVSHSPYLAMLYFHRQLRFLVQRIVGVPMHSVPHVDEFMVVNRLKGVGQTHGWHLDDPKFALVIVVDTPPRDSGGFVEVIPNWASSPTVRDSTPRLTSTRQCRAHWNWAWSGAST
jgi:hypothetical protein